MEFHGTMRQQSTGHNKSSILKYAEKQIEFMSADLE